MKTLLRRCNRTGSKSYPSELDANIAIANIAAYQANNRHKTQRDAPRKSYRCGDHWHITKN